MDMFDYIKWRSDLPFDLISLNQIDSLIFSTLCYEEFDEIFKKHKKLSINKLHDLFFQLYKEEDLKNRKSLTARSYEVLKAIAYTKRYGEIIVSNYINEIDIQNNSQFSATTFSYKSKWKYIAFRGTDHTIVGWKEDFMIAYKDTILSEMKAQNYLQSILKQENIFTKPKYYIGGHSKGGHLAIYASQAFKPKDLKRLDFIHNFDGPGFSETFWENHVNQIPISKINTFIPSSSFFGRLFTHQGKNTIIQSKGAGLMQHSPFNFQVNSIKLKKENQLSDGSNQAIDKFNELINQYTTKEREEIIEALFAIFDELNILTLADLTKIDMNHVINSIKLLNNLSSNTKKVIREILIIILKVTELQL